MKKIKKLTEEHKQKISKKMEGRKLSEETKRKISLSKKGKISNMKGKHHTEETKMKMRLARGNISEEEKRNRKLENRRKYRRNNKEKVSIQDKNWKNNNKEHINEYFKIYNSNEQNKILKQIRALTYRKYGLAKVCSICNSIIKVEHHHLLPYSADNFVDLCKVCHSKIHNGGVIDE